MSLHQPILTRPANWIVSYPRSGSMFVRSLIANYFSGLDRALTLAEITESTRGEHNEPLLAELTGKSPVERTIEEEWAVRLSYFEWARQHTNPVMPLIKSHTPNVVANGMPAFAFMRGDRIIHLVRHPCDVVVSASHYYGITIEESVSRLLHDNLCHCGAPEVGYELIGSWAQHTRSWLELEGLPLYRLRYSDLVARPTEIMLELARFLGGVADVQRAVRAAHFASFAAMKQQEESTGLVETAETMRDGYFRSGKVGQWLTRLTIDQAQRILAHDAELIELLRFRKVMVA